MSRTLSKLFVKINLILYSVNFAVLFVVMMLLLSVTRNLAVYLIPGIFFCALICLVYPDFFNMVAGLFGWQEVTNPTPTVAFDHIKQILQDATTRDYSFLKDNGIVLATFCAVVCWIVGIVCMFQQARLNKIVNSPMDWYKRKFLSTFVYAFFGGVYGLVMCVGSCAVIFAKEKLTGGFMVLSMYFLICALAIIAGVVILLVERFLSVQIFNGLTLEEQVKVCEKQSKYMNKRQRKRQVKRLGKNARTTAQLPQDDANAKNKSSKAKNNKKGKRGKQPDQPAITTVQPTNIAKPAEVPAPKQPIVPPADGQIQVVSDEILLPTDDLTPTHEVDLTDGTIVTDTSTDEQN